MDYQNREEFYGLMKQKTIEILSLDIPEEEKQKSLSLIKETIRRYEQISGDIKQREKMLKKLDNGLTNFLGICGKIDNCINELEETLPSINRFVEDYQRSRNAENN